MRLQHQECECHPLPSFGPFKKYGPLPYGVDVSMPMFGQIMIDLARPRKGEKQFGVWVKAFRYVWIFVWGHARS